MDGPAVDGAEGTWGDIPERTKVQKAAVSSNNSALGDFSPCDWIFNPWDCDFSPWDCEAPLPHGAHALLGGRTAGGAGGENGVGNLAATDCRTRHRWGGEKRSTQTGKDGTMASLPVRLKGLF